LSDDREREIAIGEFGLSPKHLRQNIWPFYEFVPALKQAQNSDFRDNGSQDAEPEVTLYDPTL
jgi:hypothetical protein